MLFNNFFFFISNQRISDCYTILKRVVLINLGLIIQSQQRNPNTPQPKQFCAHTEFGQTPPETTPPRASVYTDLC